jgi:hypothetical protein
LENIKKSGGEIVGNLIDKFKLTVEKDSV